MTRVAWCAILIAINDRQAVVAADQPFPKEECAMSVPPLAPLPSPAPRPTLRQLMYFLLGVALGSVPILVMVYIGSTLMLCPRGQYAGIHCTPAPTAPLNLACVYGLLYVIQLVVTIRLLRIQERRSIGRGLLTMLFVGPVVAAVACTIETTLPPA